MTLKVWQWVFLPGGAETLLSDRSYPHICMNSNFTCVLATKCYHCIALYSMIKFCGLCEIIVPFIVTSGNVCPLTGEPALERENSAVSQVLEDEQSDVSEAVPVASTRKPAIVAFPDDLTVMQVDCGTFHTGMYYTCVYYIRRVAALLSS